MIGSRTLGDVGSTRKAKKIKGQDVRRLNAINA
jgi:hypothetical protein